MLKILVTAQWDDEAKVWVATSDDLPLVTEAGDISELLNKLNNMIPELIAENALYTDQPPEVPFELLMKSSMRVRASC